MTKKIERIGDELVVTQTVPAVIDFHDILKNVKLEYDQDYNPLDCDGLEHEVKSVNDFVAERTDDWSTNDADIRESVESARGHFWRANGWNEYSIITVDRTQAEKDAWGAGWNKGASKQVQAENVAANIQSTIDYIKKVYENEVQAYGIVCEYEAPDGTEYSASCWGFESEDAYEGDRFDDCRDPYIQSEMIDISDEVARQMECNGYTVIKKDEYKPQESTRVMNHRHRDNVNDDNWKGEVDSGDYYGRARMRHRRRKNRLSVRRARRDGVKLQSVYQFYEKTSPTSVKDDSRPLGFGLRA